MKVIIFTILFYLSRITANSFPRSEYQFAGKLTNSNKNVTINKGNYVQCEVFNLINSGSGKIETGAEAIFTPDSGGRDTEFRYFPITEIGKPYKGCFSFKVNAGKEVLVSLSNQAQYAHPSFNFILGGWTNTVSAVRKNGIYYEKMPTPNLLEVGKFNSFWIKWDNGKVELGRKGETYSFLEHYDSLLYPFNFVGILTHSGASGTWIFEESNCPGYTPNEQEYDIKCNILG